MTTYALYTSNPADSTTTDTIGGQAVYVDTGLRVDDSVNNPKTGGIYSYTGSTVAIQLGKLMAHIQKYDRSGRLWAATSDAGTTLIKAVL